MLQHLHAAGGQAHCGLAWMSMTERPRPRRRPRQSQCSGCSAACQVRMHCHHRMSRGRPPPPLLLHHRHPLPTGLDAQLPSPGSEWSSPCAPSLLPAAFGRWECLEHLLQSLPDVVLCAVQQTPRAGHLRMRSPPRLRRHRLRPGRGRDQMWWLRALPGQRLLRVLHGPCHQGLQRQQRRVGARATNVPRACPRPPRRSRQ